MLHTPKKDEYLLNIESVNISLYHTMNANAGLAGPGLALASFLAEYLILIVPVLLILLWFCDRSEPARERLLSSFLSAMLALGCNQLIGLIYQHPRPFTVGLGHTYLQHATDSSFPSDHVTVLLTVGFALVLGITNRWAGAILIVAAMPVAWARIYLGVHFPFDMVGALGTAAISVALIRLMACHVNTLVNRPLLRFYARVVPNRSVACPPTKR